jgi:hypothetical protein
MNLYSIAETKRDLQPRVNKRCPAWVSCVDGEHILFVSTASSLVEAAQVEIESKV